MIRVNDNWGPLSLINAVKANWPCTQWTGWHCYANGKKATKSRHEIPQAARILLERMAEISIPGAFPDLEQLHGAGLHQLDAGGDLGLHIDSERHPLLPWKRESSVILYLDTISGGELEFTDESGKVTQFVSSVENRLVVFDTVNQWHRVAKANQLRRSICIFFWSVTDNATGCTTAKFQ